MNRRSIWLLAAGIAVAPALASADWYRWESENGTVSYTDDQKRVPARHRDGAERIAVRDLESYGRFTRVQRHAGPTPWQLTPEATEAEPTSAEAPKIRVQIGAGSLEVPDDDSQGPVHIRRHVWMSTGDGYTKQHTIIERDGRELAVIEGNRQ